MELGKQEEQALNELKRKLENAVKLGTPQPTGEIVMVTDSSETGGGACLFQWQTLNPEVLKDCHTQGVNADGSLKHNYPNDATLTPLGNWNWKWNSTRQAYDTHQKELLSGVLTLRSQFRIVGRKILWLGDNSAVKSFLDGAPPQNPRLRRWFVFLSQFPLT